ncbi:hypothetical protein MRX96_038850 [Rhipicephalus microplus]
MHMGKQLYRCGLCTPSLSHSSPMSENTSASGTRARLLLLRGKTLNNNVKLKNALQVLCGTVKLTRERGKDSNKHLFVSLLPCASVYLFHAVLVMASYKLVQAYQLVKEELASGESP